ncbi:hypothetical protein MC7420_8264 [Coleofasciculus chthonoplastes PCC 7420]|uniref:Uncharacterized protein n=1 Tax=Coleofasciculus chthonoplastes PCC 7420 TaxID=118168 RepID=B4W0Z1_9CYAN|nr:hypothetical protein MC7420_8264 [Coleofasciculus chthonoplastes PCC 7420]
MMGARYAPLQFLDVILIHQLRCATSVFSLPYCLINDK